MNLENNIDFFTMTVNNSEILEKTYQAFKNSIKNFDLKKCTLYLNVDPHPNNIDIENLKFIGKKYFKNVIFNVSEICNCNAAFKWGINSFTKDYLFIVEANKCIEKNFTVNEMIEKFNINPNIVEVCLNPVRNDPNLKYLTSNPSLWKKQWLKKIIDQFSENLNYEYQLRELALLDNKYGYTLANSKRKFLNHIGKKYKKDKKYLLANSSSDEEIENIIKINGEWHENIYKIYNCNRSIPSKKWIYRWTGIWKYVDSENKNYYQRYI